MDNNEILSSLYTDANGEWIWVSDMPLEQGIKRFRLMHIDNNGRKKYSDQTLIVFNNNKKNKKPKVIKFLDSNQNDVNLLNTESLNNGLSLDMVNYDPSGEFFFLGEVCLIMKYYLQILMEKFYIHLTQMKMEIGIFHQILPNSQSMSS